MKIFNLVFLTISLLFSSFIFGSLGNVNAPQGGIWKYNLSTQPTTLNPLSSTDYYATIVQSYVIDGLGRRNIETNKWEPWLATSWKVSKDGLKFTIKIREGVKWHDGRPLTVEDVKFSFDAVIHPENKYKTAHKRPYFDNFESCTIIDKTTVQFKAKRLYFGNLSTLLNKQQLLIIPKHIYENPSKKELKKLNKFLIGTGPYKFKEIRRGKHLKLTRNKKWWGNKIHRGLFNYNQVLMRFIKDGNSAIQYLQKGDLDFISLSAEEYMKKTSGKAWGKKVSKVKYKNSSPRGYSYIGWNLKNEILQSRDVRMALYHLIDREKMIKKFDYGLTLAASGPWYKQSVYADPNVKPVLYDLKKALKLLNGEGWKDSDKDGILDKKIKGIRRKLSLTILLPSKTFRKYLVVFQQDAKKAGVDIQLKVIEWNTFLKLMDEGKFDGVTLAWSPPSIDLDPKQLWHSSSSGKGGSNFIGYSNPKVDKLIDKARGTLDKKKRIPMLREVYKMVANDAPYAFLFNSNFGFYAHTKRMKRAKDTYKYSVGIGHWWMKK